MPNKIKLLDFKFLKWYSSLKKPKWSKCDNLKVSKPECCGIVSLDREIFKSKENWNPLFY